MAVETLHPDVFVDEVRGTPRIQPVGVSTGAFLGVTRKGPINRALLMTNLTQFRQRYGSFYKGNFLPHAVQGFFEEGGTRVYIGRVVGAGNATAETDVVALGAGATAGTVLSGGTQPFDLEPGETLDIKIDGGATQPFVFAATRAVRAGAGLAIVDLTGDTLLLKFDGGATQTVTFTAAATTASTAADEINAQVVGGRAVVNAGQIDLESDTRGTGSSVEVVGGTALAELGHTAGTTVGTGDVVNIDAVTAAEVVAKLSALTGATAIVEGGAVRITSDTVGTGSSVAVEASSTATGVGFDNLVHTGSASAVLNGFKVKAENPGAWGNGVKFTTTRWSRTLASPVNNSDTSATLNSVADVQVGDIAVIGDTAANFGIVHIRSVNPSTKVITFQAISLSVPASPVAAGSAVKSSSMHRGSSTLSAAALTTDLALQLVDASGFRRGSHVLVDDGTALQSFIVDEVSGNTLLFAGALGTAFASGALITSQEFFLRVTDEENNAQTPHEFLSLEPTNDKDYIENRLAGNGNESIIIELEDLSATPPILAYRNPRPVENQQLAGGLDGSIPTDNDFLGSETPPKSGLHLFDEKDDINFIAAPGITTTAVIQGISAYTERPDRIGTEYIAAVPLELDTNDEARDWRQFTINVDNTHLAVYYPWLIERDPLDANVRITLPPEGRVAGRWSDIAARRGVHIAPANITIRNVLDLTHQTTDGEQDILNPIGINVIRFRTGRGIRIWGARTLTSETDGRHLVPFRRLLSFVERSVVIGLQTFLFLPIDVKLFEQIENAVRQFLVGLHAQGILVPSDDITRAFFVKCDAENNPPETRALGKVFCDVGINPPTPAEFIVLRIGAWDGGSTVEEEIRRRG